MIAMTAVLSTAIFLSTDTCSTSEKNIVQTAVDNGNFKTLVAAVTAADLAETLSGPGPLTVFAPTDAAFAKLPEGTLPILLESDNKQMLAAILTYHVVPGNMPAAKVVASPGAKTANGQWVQFQTDEKGAMIDSAKITMTDIKCSNGVIHVIDSVILPSDKNIVLTASGAGQFKTLLAAAQAAGLAETLSNDGPYTVFAPTDEAFSKLGDETIAQLLLEENREKLQRILMNHVVKGRIYSPDALAAGKAQTLAGTTVPILARGNGARVGSAGLVVTDIDASNGVIHVIDTVLIPN